LNSRKATLGDEQFNDAVFDRRIEDFFPEIPAINRAG
jgi:hypothetical protein